MRILKGIVSLEALLLAACTAAPQAAPQASALQWDDQPGRSIALLSDGEPVWRFCYGDDRAKPCFHPLSLPGGRVLTLDQPDDHRWHHGLWFSWKLIDGVNYWEHDRSTGRPAGRTAWTVRDIERRHDGSARIALALAYGPDGGTVVLREQRVLVVGAPGATGGFAIDWHSAFHTTTGCLLDRTPTPDEPGGRPNGGYAGLSLRLVPLDDRQAITAGGPVPWNAADRFRGAAAAFEYCGVLQGEAVGVAILDHPGNPHAPSPWYAIRSRAMTFCNAAVLGRSALRLAPGGTLELRYRICVHPGRWDAAALSAAWTDYAAPASRDPE